jgi:hypothetical protein
MRRPRALRMVWPGLRKSEAVSMALATTPPGLLRRSRTRPARPWPPSFSMPAWISLAVLLVEAGDAEVAVAGLQEKRPFDGAGLHLFGDEGELDGPGVAGLADVDGGGGLAGLAEHLGELFGGEGAEGDIVDGEDLITCEMPAVGERGAGDGLQHLDAAGKNADDAAEALGLATLHALELVELAGIEKTEWGSRRRSRPGMMPS